MNPQHYEFDLSSSDVVKVTLDKQANVRLLDSTNFSSYRRGGKHRYYGGSAESSQVRLAAPYAGHWHLVIDLCGYSGTIRPSAAVLKGA